MKKLSLLFAAAVALATPTTPASAPPHTLDSCSLCQQNPYDLPDCLCCFFGIDCTGNETVRACPK
jgi:hypothetical protein